jgi:hypothetical protein
VIHAVTQLKQIFGWLEGREPVMDVCGARRPPSRNDGLQVQGTALWVRDRHVHDLGQEMTVRIHQAYIGTIFHVRRLLSLPAGYYASSSANEKCIRLR